MKLITMSFASSISYKAPNPERTAKRSVSWDVTFQEWSNRKAMAKSIRIQQRSAVNRFNWIPLVALSDIEGF